MKFLRPVANNLMGYCGNKLGFKRPPSLFIQDDGQNAKNILGKTAYYDPSNKVITVFYTGRHPKDVLRSITHELVHHMQYLRGDFDQDIDFGPGYAQKNDHLRKMEAEAYLLGNMMFRDWEDGIKYGDDSNRSKNMKDTKLHAVVVKMLKEFLEEKTQEDCGCPDTQTEDLGEVTEKADLEEDEVNEEELPDDDQNDNKGEKEENVEEIKLPSAGSAERRGRKAKRDKSSPAAARVRAKGEEAGRKKHAENPETQKLAPPAKLREGQKVFTPETEEILYEQRFQQRNNKLFQRLMDSWIKK